MNNSRKNIFNLLFLVLTFLLFTACADVSPCVETCVSNNPYGFWNGLWHGLVLPFSWIGSLFSDNIAIYACNNNGGWYDFGFVLGAIGFTLTGSKSI